MTTAVLRAELLKQRTTRTNLGLFATMVGLVLLAELLHGFGLDVAALANEARQRMLLAPGEIIGSLFAALLGAMSITGELRHGTIRPTLLADPNRIRLVTAKAWASLLAGAGFGLASAAIATATAAAALRMRDVTILLGPDDVVLPLVGGAGAGALWAAIGVGIGAVVRNQVASLVGLCAWLLFAEGLLLGDLADLGVGRYLPGAAAAALAGQEPDPPLLAPGWALLLLCGYAVVAVVLGAAQTRRRDVT